MANIGDLPEDVLVELFSLVPARELICNCQLVCVLWRDVVNLATVWKRKCQREGFNHEKWDKTIQDWKIFYFLCSLKKNLLKNPCAEESFQFWTLKSNKGDKWKVEDLPGQHGRDFPSPHVCKYFVTSYGQCLKFQLIDLKKEGYWDQLMDEIRPDIVVKDWYAARFDCGCRYELCVQLLSADYIVLHKFCPEPVIIEQWSDAEWREISYTFHNYKAGVRHILFEHGGQDTQFWAGWYGCRVTNSSITIEPGGHCREATGQTPALST
ncbi:F-box only protein 44 isoform X1 [Gopherus evgoodei]|uniref:F-box only protein 44 isoform X1 n=1 Tax=Gopherus evgoodei TaxID=1825980 RepID=UPI0011CF1DAA|nr:F-box only protein 44 isoform X1 [Gopherus evgoodei]XP_030393386.1 F-box only protein 44 isoform X1 [Gopherus evgoodei]XP_030393387.1 F-box only protein 44 isoform X1 [Gopherus evgoodei]XP_030393388.1 F-box only protein 44 isoform X1 [Gopherus evgoodei]XP_030393392.1 F-box only protein 44 isoform X1 [Gopherus evgoodei]